MLCWSSREEIPHIQGKRNPSKTVGVVRGHQRADTLKSYRKLANLVARTTALSNSVKLSHAVGGQPRWIQAIQNYNSYTSSIPTTFHLEYHLPTLPFLHDKPRFKHLAHIVGYAFLLYSVAFCHMSHDRYVSYATQAEI